jgi:hypothetical protein
MTPADTEETATMVGRQPSARMLRLRRLDQSDSRQVFAVLVNRTLTGESMLDRAVLPR